MLTSQVDFRICPSCFNVVDHDDYDVPFTCKCCQTRLYISTEDSQLAIKAPSLDEIVKEVEEIAEVESPILDKELNDDYDTLSPYSSTAETVDSSVQEESSDLAFIVGGILGEPFLSSPTEPEEIQEEISSVENELSILSELAELHSDLHNSDLHTSSPSPQPTPENRDERPSLETLIEQLKIEIPSPKHEAPEVSLDTIKPSHEYTEVTDNNFPTTEEYLDHSIEVTPEEIEEILEEPDSTLEIDDDDIIFSEEIEWVEVMDEEVLPLHEEVTQASPPSNHVPLFKNSGEALTEEAESSLETYTVTSKAPVEREPKQYEYHEPNTSYTQDTVAPSPASFKKKITPRIQQKDFRAEMEDDLTFIGKSSFNKKSFSPVKGRSQRSETGLNERRNVERKLFELESETQKGREKLENEADTDEEFGVLIRESIQEESEKKKNASKRRGNLVKSFVAFAAILTLALILAFFFISSKKQEEKITSNTQQGAEEKVEEDKYLSELVDVSVARKSLESFLNAKTLAEAEKYVLPDANIKQTLAKHWKPSPEFSEITFSKSTYLPGFTGAVYYYECTLKGQNTPIKYPVFSVKGEERPLVDWRTPHQVEDLTVNEIISSKGTGTYKVRCGITLEDYYNYDYNRDEWFSLSVWDTVSFLKTDENRLDGFLDKNTDLAKVILYQLRKQSGFLTLQGKPKAENTSFEDLLREPIGLDKIYTSLSPPSVNSYAKVILEIKVTNAEKRIVEITDLVCSSVIEYYELYQKPYLTSQLAGH